MSQLISNFRVNNILTPNTFIVNRYVELSLPFMKKLKYFIPNGTWIP